MFCCELKVAVDICKKWVHQRFNKKNLILDLATKENFKKENPLDYDNLCVI